MTILQFVRVTYHTMVRFKMMNSGSQKVAAWRTLGWIVESTKHWTVAMEAISSIKLITSLLTMTIPKLSLISLFTCLL